MSEDQCAQHRIMQIDPGTVRRVYGNRHREEKNDNRVCYVNHHQI